MGARIRGLSGPLLYNYQYDQLNRLIHMDAWNRTSTPWSAITKIPDFQESVGYDPNGNIQQYKRNGNSAISLGMDSLNYFYTAGSNKLDHITDSVNSTCAGCGDLTSQSAGNYQYDSIGELIADAQSNITNIKWTVYGKIASITKGGDTTINFTYDAGGHRISKSVIHADDTTGTWYVRDVQGNILSVYTYGDPSTNAKDLTQTELDLYGSSRLGMWKRNVDVEVKPPAPVVSIPLLGSADTLIFTRGNKLFELTNHLGNVLSTISDKRFGVSSDDSTVNYFNPDVVSANDYYLFGMLEPGRQFAQSNLGGYRYGFNGQEKTDEIAGVGNHTTAEFWEYDPRIGRRWNLDPKPSVGFSPYSAFDDNPIWHSDSKGDSAGPAPAPVKIGTLNYYVDRAADFEKRNPGKPAPTYYLNYGNVYINKFETETKPQLSPQGQEWLGKALVNLQTAIENKLQSPVGKDRQIENNDKAFTDFAFDTHVKAYEDAGVLALPVLDKVNILLTPKAEDLFSDRGLKQAEQIGNDQFVYYLFHPVFAVQQAKEAGEKVEQITTLAHGYYLQNQKFFDNAAKTNPQGWSDPEHKIIGIVRDIIFPTFRF